MAETERFAFSHSEVVEALVKKQGLHEGVWRLYVEFGIGAINAGSDANSLAPCAVVPVVKLGLVRADEGESNNLTVDAAKVNPTK